MERTSQSHTKLYVFSKPVASPCIYGWFQPPPEVSVLESSRALAWSLHSQFCLKKRKVGRWSMCFSTTTDFWEVEAVPGTLQRI